jgi:hypothetical protein
MRTMSHPRKTGHLAPDPAMQALDLTGAWPRSATDDCNERGKYAKEHDRAAAIRPLVDDGKRARRDRLRHSEQRLRARIRRNIRTQWNLSFVWRRPMPGCADAGHSKVRPCSSCCWYCRFFGVRSLDGAFRTLVPMRSRSACCRCASQRCIHARCCQARPHRCDGAALPVAARGRPQAARRHRVAAAWCLLRAVSRPSSVSTAARRPLGITRARTSTRTHPPSTHTHTHKLTSTTLLKHA